MISHLSEVTHSFLIESFQHSKTLWLLPQLFFPTTVAPSSDLRTFSVLKAHLVGGILVSGIWDKKTQPSPGLLKQEARVSWTVIVVFPWCHEPLGHRRYWNQETQPPVLWDHLDLSCIHFSLSLDICILSLSLSHLTISYSSVFSRPNPAMTLLVLIRSHRDWLRQSVFQLWIPKKKNLNN